MELLGQNEVDHRQRKVVILSQDRFYKVLTAEQKAKALKGQYNFDHPGRAAGRAVCRAGVHALAQTPQVERAGPVGAGQRRSPWCEVRSPRPAPPGALAHTVVHCGLPLRLPGAEFPRGPGGSRVQP